MKIAISGTYSTGKTTTTLALSYLTGISKTHAKTMREILPIAYPGKRLEACLPHELIELGIRRFLERCESECQYNNHFISDGCAMQEWIYGTARLKYGLNPNEHILKVKWQKMSNYTSYEVFQKTIEAFGLVAKQYVKNNYDVVVHLPIEFAFTPDGHRPVKEKFRSESEKLLLQTYDEWNIKPLVVTGKLEQRLQQIVKALNLPQQMSITEAVELAMRDKINLFDSMKLETQN
ncbi:MAG: ATP-binding protein [Prolixibacteraceae bacterium]|nr:ATP-binding protein [Prolixibacteraceae bacterium]